MTACAAVSGAHLAGQAGRGQGADAEGAGGLEVRAAGRRGEVEHQGVRLELREARGREQQRPARCSRRCPRPVAPLRAGPCQPTRNPSSRPRPCRRAGARQWSRPCPGRAASALEPSPPRPQPVTRTRRFQSAHSVCVSSTPRGALGCSHGVCRQQLLAPAVVQKLQPEALGNGPGLRPGKPAADPLAGAVPPQAPRPGSACPQPAARSKVRPSRTQAWAAAGSPRPRAPRAAVPQARAPPGSSARSNAQARTPWPSSKSSPASPACRASPPHKAKIIKNSTPLSLSILCNCRLRVPPGWFILILY